MFEQVLPTQAQLQITQLDILETGTYNPMYARPFQMNVSGDRLQDITARVENSGGQGVSASLLGGIAGSILRPTEAAQHQVPIHMGWAERRLRFVMWVEARSPAGTISNYIFQGFTSYAGVSHGGAIDEKEMEFFINSYIRTNGVMVQTDYGTEMRYQVTESAQVINGQIVRNLENPEADVYGMRPGDIYTGIQSGYLQNAYSGYGQGSLLDTRVQLGGDSVNSKRGNCLPSNYLAGIVTNYRTASDLISFGQGTEDIYGRARELSYEPSPNENPFIRQLSHVRSMPNQTRFTYSNLRTISPHIDSVTTFRVLGPTARATMHQAGQTAYWHGRDHDTIWASLLSNAVPALMTELMIGRIDFSSTNDAIGGVINTAIGDISGLSNVDMSSNMRMFIHRLQSEILSDLAYDGHIFHLRMSCNIYGESTIDLKLDASPPSRFTTPSFSDGLFAPVFTSEVNSYSSMVNNFEVLMNQLPGNAGNKGLNTAI